jgi:hypothetical protein
MPVMTLLPHSRAADAPSRADAAGRATVRQRRRLGVLRTAAAAFAALLGGTVSETALAAAYPGPSMAAPEHWGVLEKYCESCHNSVDWAAGLAFDTLSPRDVPTDAETWEKAIRKLRTGMMPPAGKPRPARAMLDGLAADLEARLDAAAEAHPYVGAVSLHRLNRTEYRNAVRDVLAYEPDVATLLPADDVGEGFDNIADVLSVSPTLIQSYLAAAAKISRSAVGDRTMAPTLAKYAAPPGLSQDEHIEGLPLGTRGGMLIKHYFPLDAEYEFRVNAGTGFRFAGPAGGPAPTVDVTIDGVTVNPGDRRRFRLRVKAGPRVIGVALVEKRRWRGVDDLYQRASYRPDDFESLLIDGPFDPTGPGDTPSRRAIFSCHPRAQREEESCARSILVRLATKAFRRPVRADDPALAPLMQFYAAGRGSGDFEAGIQNAIARLLVDPQFLYRIEPEPQRLAAGAVYRLSDLELASRLSFFLWSTIPDDELRDVAAKGRLHEPRTLERETRRMLADPRSSALVENFAGEWLQLRELKDAQPADPQFDENLRRSMLEETQLLFASIVREDRSVVQLLDSDYTYVDERLARHYGIPGIHGSYMRRIALPPDSPRRGLLGQASVLTVTSAGDRTSPVMRGAWIMENLLGAPVPRPPPGVVTELKQDPNAARPLTVRARLEQHRANPTCAACHQIMDPLGFSLENFDLDGRWREREGAQPVDATGKLVDGTALAGVQDLRHALLDRSDAFVASLTQKLLTYALGRRLVYRDAPTIRQIVHEASRSGDRFSAIVLGIVESPPFQMREKRAAPAGQAMATSQQARIDPSATRRRFE